jgi:hypothetical protein
MSWPTTTFQGEQYYLFDGVFLLPVNPVSGAGVILCKANGFAVGAGIPAVETGPPGKHIELQMGTFIALDPGDATPDSASLTTVTPPDDDTVGVYALNLSLHKGQKGDDGDSNLEMDSISGTPVAKYIAVVNGAANGFEYKPQLVGDRVPPAALYNTGSGNVKNTVAVFQVLANTVPYAWRPEVEAGCVITGEGADVRYDVIARLNGETGGNIVGRGFGPIGTNSAGIQTTIIPGPPAGSSDTFDKVAANAAATVHVRVERQAGSLTCTTSTDTTWARMRICPVP